MEKFVKQYFDYGVEAARKRYRYNNYLNGLGRLRASFIYHGIRFKHRIKVKSMTINNIYGCLVFCIIYQIILR